MVKKFHNRILVRNTHNKIITTINNDDDELNANFFVSLSTDKYFNRSLDAGCNVMIVDKDNNIVEFSPTRGKKIVSKLEHPDYKLSEIKSMMEKKSSKFIIKTQWQKD